MDNHDSDYAKEDVPFQEAEADVSLERSDDPIAIQVEVVDVLLQDLS